MGNFALDIVAGLAAEAPRQRGGTTARVSAVDTDLESQPRGDGPVDRGGEDDTGGGPYTWV